MEVNQVKFYQGVEIRTQESGGPNFRHDGFGQEEGTQWIDGHGAPWFYMAASLMKYVMLCPIDRVPCHHCKRCSQELGNGRGVEGVLSGLVE